PFLDAVNWGNLTRHVRLFADALGRAGGNAASLAESGRFAKLIDEAEKLERQFRPPLEQLDALREKLDAMKAARLIDADLADRAFLDSFGKLEKGAGLGQVNLAPSAKAGSSQAASIISNFEVRP